MKNPWFKFNPTLWRGDEQLRNCSIAARGLWIEMLCLMHRATPYGHLLINGEAPTDAQLAVQTGIPTDQLFALRAELDKAGVFSRTGKGVIYSRRMTEDFRKSKEGEKSAKKRWKHQKPDNAEITETKDENLRPNGVAIGKANAKPHAKKIEDRKKEYWWAGSVIKLNRQHYDEWLALYGGNDDQFTDWLIDRDRWFNEKATPQAKANWFHSTLAMLKKIQQGETA